ncbi:MAG: MBL fold metallo-hydrolase [Methanobacterium sp.]|nr:MBL fold metallo-hydrolase [Methanobacterium sp.]
MRPKENSPVNIIMRLKKYPYKKNIANNWELIFQNPCNITIESFQTGTVKLNRQGTINPDHPLGKDVQEEELEVPILSHWIHHESKGDFLLDTGLDASYIRDKLGGLEGSGIDEFQLKENENIAYHIQKKNIHLNMIFLSHLHSDHAAGVRELPKDIPYVIAKGEYAQYQPEIPDFLEGLEELYEIDFSHAQHIHPLGPSADLLGDSSLWAIHTPGHTPNHISFLINTLDGPILQTMDAAFIYENLKLGVAPSDYTWDVDKAQKTLERIIDFLNKYPQVRVGTGHEAFK